MTDVSNLDDLARAISSSSPKIRDYAIAQAAATQAQELDIRDALESIGDLGAALSALTLRVAALENAPDPEPEPEPEPGELPFAEAALRTGFTTVKPAAGEQRVVAPAGKDCLIDLQGLKRTVGRLEVFGSGDQRIQIVNGWFEGSVPIGATSPYWRGCIGIKSADGIGPAHISITNILTCGPTVPDAITIASTKNTKLTIQRWRHESRFHWDRTDLPEPAEHCDALQVQGLIGALEVGLATVYCQNVALGNEGGKCFQLKNEGGNDGFPIALRKVNMRGGGRTGTFLLQTTRDLPIALADVYAADDGISTGAAWTWATSGGGMFAPNAGFGGSAVSWVRSGTPGLYVAGWPEAAAITGVIRQGVPAGGDYVPRSALAFL